MSPRTTRGFEGELFARHHHSVLRSVRQQVSGSDAMVEDACSFAWVQLLTHEVEFASAVAWLVTVAKREAWRLWRIQQRTASLEEMRPDREAGPESARVGATTVSLELQLEARDALVRVATLPARQRRLFGRQVAGLGYEEIGAETGDSYRTVNRQLQRAHRSIRDRARGDG